MNNKKRVVVTGAQVITPLGDTWQEIFTGLKKKENTIRYMKEWDCYDKLKSRLAAPAKFTVPNYSRKQLRGMGRVALLGVTCAERALAESNLLDNPVLTQGETGIAFGVSTGSIEAISEIMSVSINESELLITPTSYIRYMPQTVLVNIAIHFGIKGRVITSDVACASGSLALGSAYEMIQSGKQKVMLAGGGDELTFFTTAIFDALSATSRQNNVPKSTPAAFDTHRDGLVIGEGAGVFVLEEYQHAKARNAHILFEIAGFAQTCDGRHITQPNREMMAKVMEMALEDAGISSKEIGYVNAHGTGTEMGDIEESIATMEVFQRPIPISTQKSYIGHTLAGCGVIESYFSMMMMKEQWFAPNLNLVTIDQQLPALDYIIGEGREINTDYVMTNNFAFGGINTSLIFKRFAE